MSNAPPASPRRPPAWDKILARMNVNAGFGNAFVAISSTVLNRYAQTLAMTPFGFGVLAALPFLTALAQIPGSFVVERFGHRRALVIVAILVHRALWLAIAAIPWVLPHAWWWLGLLALVALSNTALHAGTPAITSWIADLVPSRLRGRYFSLRGQIARLINVPLCLGIGWAMDHAKFQGTGMLLQTLSVMLAIAALLGMLDGLLCFTLPDLWSRPRERGLHFRDIVFKPLEDRNFRFFLGYTGFMTFATAFVGPFVWLYLTDVVRESNAEAVFMTMVGTAVVSLIGMRYWGSVVDRWGYKRVMLIAGLLIINGATAWLAVTPGTKWIGYLPALISAFAWPGIELASGNILYALSETRRDGSGLGSAYVAFNSAVVAATGTLSGLLCGWVAELLKAWQTTVFGYPVTFHAVLFFFSAIFRVIALCWILGLRDDRRETGEHVLTETASPSPA